MKDEHNELSAEEVEQRREAALKRLLSTPPQPKKSGKPPKKRGRPPKKDQAAKPDQ